MLRLSLSILIWNLFSTSLLIANSNLAIPIEHFFNKSSLNEHLPLLILYCPKRSSIWSKSCFPHVRHISRRLDYAGIFKEVNSISSIPFTYRKKKSNGKYIFHTTNFEKNRPYKKHEMYSFVRKYYPNLFRLHESLEFEHITVISVKPINNYNLLILNDVLNELKAYIDRNSLHSILYYQNKFKSQYKKTFEKEYIKLTLKIPDKLIQQKKIDTLIFFSKAETLLNDSKLIQHLFNPQDAYKKIETLLPSNLLSANFFLDLNKYQSILPQVYSNLFSADTNKISFYLEIIPHQKSFLNEMGNLHTKISDLLQTEYPKLKDDIEIRYDNLDLLRF